MRLNAGTASMTSNTAACIVGSSVMIQSNARATIAGLIFSTLLTAQAPDQDSAKRLTPDTAAATSTCTASDRGQRVDVHRGRGAAATTLKALPQASPDDARQTRQSSETPAATTSLRHSVASCSE